MNAIMRPVQIIETPGGERLVVLLEEHYLSLLRAHSDQPIIDPDDGALLPDFAEELRRRIADVDAGGPVVPLDALRRG